MIALFCFFQLCEVILQIFFAGPSRAVNALQHFVFAITAPISSRQFHEFEVLELACAGHVRAAAQIFKRAFFVQTHIFIGRNAANDFCFVMLAEPFEISHRLITRQHTAQHRLVFVGQFGHALFDGSQIFQGERTAVREVVIKTVFNDRANGDLCIRVQIFDGISQQVGRGVTHHFKAIGIFGRDDGKLGIAANAVACVHHFAVDFASQGRFGQASANGGSNLCHSDRTGKFTQ